ncbi:MAG TPA: enoyl-CoA hydratase/isomerase family protein [Asanoa sp.]|nr:enoyl-CoA hydratase/isomerase family protein [Asanoa sp.]
MTTSGVEVSHAGPVATVTLRRPDVLNAQTPATWLALRDIGRALPGDVRVVIVRGEGRSFSAGLDISGGAGSGFLAEIGQLTPDAAADRVREYQEGFTWLHRPDIVSVAAVQGHAIGAGFQLALACDLRVLADDARLTMAEVTLGLVPDLAGTKRLVELVGYARALEVCLTGRRLGADEALSLGLATVVVPRDDLDSAVSDLVAALLSAPRDAVVEMKALLSGAASRSWEEQLRAEREAQVRRLRDLAGLGE